MLLGQEGDFKRNQSCWVGLVLDCTASFAVPPRSQKGDAEKEKQCCASVPSPGGDGALALLQSGPLAIRQDQGLQNI